MHDASIERETLRYALKPLQSFSAAFMMELDYMSRNPPKYAEKHQFRRRGHSMPPRSRKCIKSGKFFFRQQKNKILFYFIKKIIFFIKIKNYFYFFIFETKKFPLWIFFISMNWYHRPPILGSICDNRPRR
jgi:hypothetical protein